MRMSQLKLKPTHKPIRDYYATLQAYDQHKATHEGAVSNPFAFLLDTCAKQVEATLIPQYQMHAPNGNRIVIDGAILDEYSLPIAYWEAKDIDDDLPKAVEEKRAAGYPLDNILFQNPQRAILYQNGQVALDSDIRNAAGLISALECLFAYVPPALENWQSVVNDFKEHVPALAGKLKELIDEQHTADTAFQAAFASFYETCRTAINPELSHGEVEEMLIQHILTERIFRTVFNNSDFTRRNIIAREIENVVDKLIHRAFSRDVFLAPLDRFYSAIEQAALFCKDFSQKQHFLNTFYEQFFQGFSEDTADTHGIVYTPQPIVDFMVNSVQHILKTEFDRSLSDSGVHIIDPFVGTGNFIVRLMQALDPISLERKYTATPPELHCNEVMLLPYYIASLNIEQEYFRRTGAYLPFEGIVLADTFELLEQEQGELFTRENTERVLQQKSADMFVVIGNPPYNAGQKNENDNNKNRKHPLMDARVAETYVTDSAAQNRNKLYDPYVKAIRWASDRIGAEGIVALVTNNSFLDRIAFDGMRKHLAQDFTKIYHINMKGDARTSGERRRKEGGNVFEDQIRVGVGISFFIKKAGLPAAPAEVWLYAVEDYMKSREKQDLLVEFSDYTNVPLKQAVLDARHTWLTEGLRPEFETFVPMGTKAVKSKKSTDGATIFNLYSCGVSTSRDSLVYASDLTVLQERVRTFIEIYNTAVDRKRRHDPNAPVERFIDTTDPRIKWSRQTKKLLKKLELSIYEDSHFRNALYRPFCQKYLYFDDFWNEERYQQYVIFPTLETEAENQVICVSCPGTNSSFRTLIVDAIPDIHITGDTQCFPFYTYDEDGANRRENITDWALAHFRSHYKDDTISKWDIFHYTYGLLHHPDYRERYEANLKRDLPHIPFAADFWAFATAGAQLADLHVNYESQPEYEDLKLIQNPEVPLNWRVEKMKLSKDKTQLIYNEFLTLEGIPAEAFAYRLGTRSALEWVIDQYCVKTHSRSGLVTDPNCADAPRYIVDLVARVITISLKTVEIVKSLPELSLNSGTPVPLQGKNNG